VKWRFVGMAVACAVGAAAVAQAAETPTREITMPGKLFEPSHVAVLVGTTVTWRNGDSTNHTVTSDGDAFDSGYVAAGGSFSYAFQTPGRFAYHCAIHRFMKGEVDVFSLVLTGPEHPVGVGHQVIFAGLAPPGTQTVTLSRVGGGDAPRSVTARSDGSFIVRFHASTPGLYRAAAGPAVSPSVRIRVVPRVEVARTPGALLVTTSPMRPGARVVLQVYERDFFSWRPIAATRLDARSRARLALPSTRPIRLRVVVPARDGWSDGASPAIVLGRSAR